MKKLAAGLVLAMLLVGCGKTEAVPPRVVIGVEVVYQQHGELLQRSYFREESMRMLLLYLRMLDPRGPMIPEQEDDISCQFILRYSDGTESVFLQQGITYLQKNGGAWEKIDAEQAQLLYPLLLLLPSDL